MKRILKILLVSLLVSLSVFVCGAKAKTKVAKNVLVVNIAKKYVGTPYIWGGSSPRGFDCSGFIKYVYAKIHIYLPHYTRFQYSYGRYINRNQLRPGDLVFFNNLGHVGMYIGNHSFIHAPRSGDYVRISSIHRDSYYGARRLL